MSRLTILRPWFPALLALRSTLLCAALLSAPALADDGDPDAGFGTNGRAIHAWPSSTIQSETNAVAAAADGSVVVAGWLSYPVPTQHDAISLVRFRADGMLDAAFGNAGVALFDLDPTSQIGERAAGVFTLPDGRTQVVATVQVPGTMGQQPLLLAVRADGTPDTAFGDDGVRSIDIERWAGDDVRISATALQRDGRIVLAGAIVTDTGADALVTRILPNGDVDAAFGDAGWTRLHRDESLIATSVVIDDIGRVVLAGRTLGSGTPDRPLIARLGADGVADAGFGDAGVVRADTGLAGSWSADAVATAVRTVDLQRRIFVAISRTSPRSTGILALGDDGLIATGFADDGFFDLSREEGARITTLAMRRDRRLVAAGWIDPNGAGVSDFYVARLTFDGTLDPAFDGNGVARYPMNADGDTYDTPTAMVLSGERPVIAGTLINTNTPSYHAGVLRLQSDALYADGFD
jgi:uncharacterized delta-60 repeat protein